MEFIRRVWGGELAGVKVPGAGYYSDGTLNSCDIDSRNPFVMKCIVAVIPGDAPIARL